MSTVAEGVMALIAVGVMVWTGWSLDVAAVIVRLEKELLYTESEMYHCRVGVQAPIVSDPAWRQIEWVSTEVGADGSRGRETKVTYERRG